MISSKKNSSRIGRGLLWCCLLLLVSVGGTCAEEDLSQTEYEGGDNDDQIMKLTVLTTRTPVSEGISEHITRLPDSGTTTTTTPAAAPCEELPLPPENGYITKGDKSSSGSGEVVRVRCEEGYGLSGPSTLYCLVDTEGPVVWVPKEEYLCLPSANIEELQESTFNDIFDGEVSDEKEQPYTEDMQLGVDDTAVHSAPPPPSVLLSAPDTGDTEAPRFNPRQHPISAGRLTDTWPNVQAVEGLPWLCSLPPMTGPCRMAIPRYFFSTALLECRPFTYGGCDGNENNFETFEACQAACR